MRPFSYSKAADPLAAVKAGTAAGTKYLAGGTTLLDLMKLDVERPVALLDITGLDPVRYGRVEATRGGVRIGALARMADVAEDPMLRRDYPVLTQSLWLAASQQLRNMARLGGNVLQRTRCAYFRDTSYDRCNRRAPGSGCEALDGINRGHAVLGTSDACIAMYPGDWAQALVALDATVDVLGPAGARTLRFDALHRLPGTTPDIETTMQPGELITAFNIPATKFARRSLYLKVRDRESYAFASASAAVALDLRGGDVREARIGLGGVASVPWRAREAEAALAGKRLDEASAGAAAEIAFAGARPREHNAYKVPLGKATLVRALLAARDLDVS